MIQVRRFTPTDWAGLIVEIVKTLQPDRYVEVGVLNGHTFKHVAPYTTHAVAIDINPAAIERTRRAVIGMRPRCPDVQLFIGTAQEYAVGHTDPIDVVFIDANHDKEWVLADFDAVAPFVVEGTGLILLHDTQPVLKRLRAPTTCSNAWEAAEEIRRGPRSKDFEIVTLAGPWQGLSIVRKAPKQLYFYTRKIGWRGTTTAIEQESKERGRHKDK